MIIFNPFTTRSIDIRYTIHVLNYYKSMTYNYIIYICNGRRKGVNYTLCWPLSSFDLSPSLGPLSILFSISPSDPFPCMFSC